LTFKPQPLPKCQIRDLNREIDERLHSLAPMRELVIVKSTKKGRLYGIGFNSAKDDLILRNLIRVIGGLYRPRPAADLNTSVSLTDITNVARTVRTGWNTTPTMITGTAGGDQTRAGSLLGFGNPAAPPTPARTDYELASKVAEIVPSGTTTDETNWRVAVTGSYVWAAGGTVRETGQYEQWYDEAGTRRTFLIYHDAVSDVVVPAGGTVSVTYTTQF